MSCAQAVPDALASELPPHCDSLSESKANCPEINSKEPVAFMLSYSDAYHTIIHIKSQLCYFHKTPRLLVGPIGNDPTSGVFQTPANPSQLQPQLVGDRVRIYHPHYLEMVNCLPSWISVTVGSADHVFMARERGSAKR